MAIEIKGTAKIFKYNAKFEGIVEGNTVQYPFIAEYKGERKTAMDYTWHTKDKDGKLCKRGIFVSGHGQYGIPTLYDADILITLQDIFFQKKTMNGVCELKTKDLTEDDLKIDFSINELAREMGYSLPVCNKTRESIKKSIETLVATTIFSRYEGGIYDITNKKYISNTKIGYHYIEGYESGSIKDGEEEIFDVTRIKLSMFTYTQIINNFKLFYDKAKYRKPKNKMSRKIYNMVLQWKGDKDVSWVSMEKIMERIPMIESQERYRKRYIKNALKELHDNKVVKISYKNELICFDFRNNFDKKQLLNKYNSYAEIRETFIIMGFDLYDMDKYLDLEKVRYIQALLRYLDAQQPIHKKQYFMKCYDDNIDLDKVYYNEEI